MATASVTIRMDEKLKKQAEVMFNDMGMNMTTAVNVFVKTVVRQGKIPFEIEVDRIYSGGNARYLRDAISALDSGCGIAHDIIEVPDE